MSRSRFNYMCTVAQLFFWNIIRGSKFTLNWWITQSKNHQTATFNFINFTI